MMGWIRVIAPQIEGPHGLLENENGNLEEKIDLKEKNSIRFIP